MNLIEVIKERKSIRSFIDKQVSIEDVLEILEAARWAPSASNLQPWEFWAVTGKKRQELVGKLLEALQKSGTTYSPGGGLSEKYAERLNKLISDILPFIEKAGIIDPNWIMKGSLSFYGAPVVIIVLFDKGSHSNKINVGIAIQNILLSAYDKGLGACSLNIPLRFESIIRETLDVPKNLKISNTIALGYIDEDNPLNNFKSSRAPIDEISKLIGFDER